MLVFEGASVEMMCGPVHLNHSYRSLVIEMKTDKIITQFDSVF